MPHARPASLVKLALSLFAATVVTTAATAAQADCDPACVSPAVCRYEASGGGRFYCEAPRGRGGSARMQGRGGRRSSTANQGAAPAPTREAPNGARSANPR